MRLTGTSGQLRASGQCRACTREAGLSWVSCFGPNGSTWETCNSRRQYLSGYGRLLAYVTDGSCSLVAAATPELVPKYQDWLPGFQFTLSGAAPRALLAHTWDSGDIDPVLCTAIVLDGDSAPCSINGIAHKAYDPVRLGNVSWWSRTYLSLAFSEQLTGSGTGNWSCKGVLRTYTDADKCGYTPAPPAARCADFGRWHYKQCVAKAGCGYCAAFVDPEHNRCFDTSVGATCCADRFDTKTCA